MFQLPPATIPQSARSNMSSARARKNKGKRLQDATRKLLLEYFDLLSESDIKTAVMSEGGRDIKLSAAAERLIPFDIECKNQESISVWNEFKQAEANTSEGRTPLLVFTRNHAPIYAMLKFTDLLTILAKIQNGVSVDEALAIVTKAVTTK